MDGMNGTMSDDGMGNMGMASPPFSSSSSMNSRTATGGDKMISTMTHMTFFWSKNSEILFSGWPGTRSGMYALALVFVLVLAVLVEWLSDCKLIKPGSNNNAAAGLLQSLMHAMRVGVAYLVMLAVMSFNGGVFLVAVAGHALGFLLFRSQLIFSKSSPSPKITSHLSSPMSTC